MSDFRDETYKRIEDIINHNKLNIRSFEEEIGVSNNSIGTAIRRKSSFKSNVLNKILHSFPEINPTWLLTGEGDMFLNKVNEGVVNDTSLRYEKLELKDKVRSVLLELFLEEDIAVKRLVKEEVKKCLKDS